MRILFLTYHFPTPQEPGAARPWETAQLLRALGHEVVVITAGTHYMTGEDTRKKRKGLWSLEAIDGFRVIKTFAPSRHRRSFRRRLLNYLTYAALAFLAGLRECRWDAILMATDPPFIMPFGFLLARLRRASLILDERDLYPDTAVALGYLRSTALIKILETWQHFFRRRASRILAATPGIKRLLVQKGISSHKIVVFPNVPFSFHDNVPGDCDLRKDRGWGNAFLVLYAGTFGQANELSTILKAARLLQARAPQVRFVFIGDGEKKASCLAFCEEHDVRNVEFLSPQPRELMPHYLAAADVCIHSFSRHPFWECALSTKIFDAMLAGKPIVFAGRGDAADLIMAAQAGMVVEPEKPDLLAEAILFLYQQPSLREEMGANGRRYVLTHFSRQEMAHRLAQALQP